MRTVTDTAIATGRKLAHSQGIRVFVYMTKDENPRAVFHAFKPHPDSDKLTFVQEIEPPKESTPAVFESLMGKTGEAPGAN